MKKISISILTILTCGSLYALPVGSPFEASLLCDGLLFEGHCGDPCDPCISWCDALSFRVGFYGDYVFNRHLEVKQNSHGADIDHTEIYTNAGYLAANLWDRFDIFVTLGASNIRIETDVTAFVIVPAFTENFPLVIETGTEFSWSIGARGTIWECGCTVLGIEGQYFRTKPHIARITEAAVVSEFPANDVSLKYEEWQVGVGISHRIHMLVPYLAIKWANGMVDADNFLPFVSIDNQTDLEIRDLEPSKHLGYVVGVSLVDCEKAAITAEGRFGDEKAFYINGQLRF
ncbi:MAG: Major outer membrane porin [Chlamydiae bacterium]|nr:Major outer membrane porin [Chlamydiota bacterium]